MTPIEDVLWHSLAQDGDRYVFGAEALPTDVDPELFDCSELIEWSCARAGVSPKVPDGSWIQYRHCRDRGELLTIDQGIATRGALLFRFVGNPDSGGRPSQAHVGWSLGDGTTIEARGTKWGVGSWTAYGRGWTHAGLLPGIAYSPTDHVIHEETDMTPDEHDLLLRIGDDSGQAKNEAGAAKVEAAAAKGYAADALRKVGEIEKAVAGIKADIQAELDRDRAQSAYLADLVLSTGLVDREKVRAETGTYLDNLAKRPGG